MGDQLDCIHKALNALDMLSAVTVLSGVTIGYIPY